MEVVPPAAELPAAPPSEPAPWLAASLCSLAVLVPRALLFSLNENLYGDAVARTELALHWLSRPRWISSFQDGAYQFGPLHLYLLGLALKLLPDREHAGRVVSLLFGVGSTFPLFFLTRRLFHWRAAVFACLALAAWGMHIQMSDTAGSEALSLCLLFLVVAAMARGIGEGRLGDVLWAALLLNLLCAVRYDAWLLLPLCALGIALSGPDRVASVTRSVLFAFAASPFVLVWMDGNEQASGRPFFPIEFIDSFHREWVKSEAARLGNVTFRVYAFLFWPGVALFTLGPLLAVGGALGMRRAWREGQARWLVALALFPTAYFTLKGAVMFSFAPLARFAVAQVALLLPFAWYGFEARRVLRPASLAMVAVISASLFVLTAGRETALANALRPVSPVSQNPADVMAVARFLKSNLSATALLEKSPTYQDLQLAFFSGYPEERLIRQRWPDHLERLAQTVPDFIVKTDGAELRALPGIQFDADADALDWGGQRYVAESGDFGRFRIFRRR